jgi:hypothetical protein
MGGPNTPPKFITGLGDVITLDHKPWQGEDSGFKIGELVTFGLRVTGKKIGQHRGYLIRLQGKIIGFSTINGRRVIDVDVVSEDPNVKNGLHQFRQLRHGWINILEGASDVAGRLYLEKLVINPIDIKN